MVYYPQILVREFDVVVCAGLRRDVKKKITSEMFGSRCSLKNIILT